MSKHTPGPWRVFMSKSGHRIIGIGDVNAEGVADCGFGVWRGGSEEALANAHLIAAAPDLLDACNAARIVIKNRDQNEREAAVLDALKIAIAKAEGRP